MSALFLLIGVSVIAIVIALILSDVENSNVPLQIPPPQSKDDHIIEPVDSDVEVIHHPVLLDTIEDHPPIVVPPLGTTPSQPVIVLDPPPTHDAEKLAEAVAEKLMVKLTEDHTKEDATS